MYRNLKIITTEINVLVNMQGKSLSTMLLYISPRQTRSWTTRTKKQQQPKRAVHVPRPL